jgi:hypothetical protein
MNCSTSFLAILIMRGPNLFAGITPSRTHRTTVAAETSNSEATCCGVKYLLTVLFMLNLYVSYLYSVIRLRLVNAVMPKPPVHGPPLVANVAHAGMCFYFVSDVSIRVSISIPARPKSLRDLENVSGVSINLKEYKTRRLCPPPTIRSAARNSPEKVETLDTFRQVLDPGSLSESRNGNTMETLWKQPHPFIHGLTVLQSVNCRHPAARHGSHPADNLHLNTSTGIARCPQTPFHPGSAHSNDVDQSIRFDADQIGAKRRKALSV